MKRQVTNGDSQQSSSSKLSKTLVASGCGLVLAVGAVGISQIGDNDRTAVSKQRKPLVETLNAASNDKGTSVKNDKVKNDTAIAAGNTNSSNIVPVKESGQTPNSFPTKPEKLPINDGQIIGHVKPSKPVTPLGSGIISPAVSPAVSLLEANATVVPASPSEVVATPNAAVEPGESTTTNPSTGIPLPFQPTIPYITPPTPPVIGGGAGAGKEQPELPPVDDGLTTIPDPPVTVEAPDPNKPNGSNKPEPNQNPNPVVPPTVELPDLGNINGKPMNQKPKDQNPNKPDIPNLIDNTPNVPPIDIPHPVNPADKLPKVKLTNQP